MKFFVPFLLIHSLLLISCVRKENSAAMTPGTDFIEGTYQGYRSQYTGQQVATDSTKITLVVKRLSGDQVEILQTSPNEFKYIVIMHDNHFTYNLGITEAACGAASINGEGTFQANGLYLLETLACTRNLTAAKTFTQLRATKQ